MVDSFSVSQPRNAALRRLFGGLVDTKESLRRGAAATWSGPSSFVPDGTAISAAT
jgi:hypothetical protein